jgi:hypothetical protein
MKVKKIKSTKKPMALEDFALAIQTDLQATRKETRDGFAAVREEMATKADLWPMGRDIKTLEKNVRYLRDDVKNITDAMVSKADLANTLAEELAKSQYAKQIENLQIRVNVLESKLGIKPNHRAT